MKIFKGLVLMAALATGAGACSYGGVAATADGKAIIAQNNGLLFGMLNKVFVCNVTPTGLAGCAAGESP
jgi:hypothetical protein